MENFLKSSVSDIQIYAIHIKSDVASRNTDVIEGRPEKRRCGENCRASRTLYSQRCLNGVPTMPRARKKEILKDLRLILTTRRWKSGAHVNGLLASIHPCLEIRIATRPLRPPFFDARDSLGKNGKEGEKKKKTIILSEEH